MRRWTMLAVAVLLVGCGEPESEIVKDWDPGPQGIERIHVDIPDPPAYCLEGQSIRKRCMYDAFAGFWLFQPPVGTGDSVGFEPRMPAWAENCLRDGGTIAAFRDAHGELAPYCDRGQDTTIVGISVLDSADVADSVNAWYNRGSQVQDPRMVLWPPAIGYIRGAPCGCGAERATPGGG